MFKDDLDHWCLDLGEEEVRVVAVLTVAAPRGPKTRRGEDGEEAIRDEKVAEELRGKIRLVYRMAAGNGKEYIVLGTYPFSFLTYPFLLSHSFLLPFSLLLHLLTPDLRRCDGLRRVRLSPHPSRSGDEGDPVRGRVQGCV